MKTKAAVMYEPNAPLVVEEIELVDTDSKDGFEDLPVEPVIIHTVRRL